MSFKSSHYYIALVNLRLAMKNLLVAERSDTLPFGRHGTAIVEQAKMVDRSKVSIAVAVGVNGQKQRTNACPCRPT